MSKLPLETINGKQYQPVENELRLIVRLSHNNYMHKGRLVSESKLTLLKRKSIGELSDLIQDPDYDLAQLNLGKYDSGVYRLITINKSYDIESGIVDDWELTLVPFVEPGDTNEQE